MQSGDASTAKEFICEVVELTDPMRVRVRARMPDKQVFDFFLPRAMCPEVAIRSGVGRAFHLETRGVDPEEEDRTLSQIFEGK